MKILIISPYFPYPTTHGGKVRIFNIIKYFYKKGYQITLASFPPVPKKDSHFFRYMKKFCKNIEELPSNDSIIPTYKIFFSKFPSFYIKYISKKAGEKIDRIIEKNKFDIIQIEYTYGGLSILKKYPILTSLMLHEIEYETTKRKIKNAGFLKKFYWHFQNIKIKNIEKSILRYPDICFVCSKIDRDYAKALCSDIDVDIIPNGVDTEYNKFSDKEPSFKNSLIFTGAMDTIPNQDGIMFFVREIMPLIEKKIPDIRVTVAGSNPQEKIKNLEYIYKNITVTGYVKDIRKYIYASTVFIAPLRIGGGTRLKILEAMALGRPVVSTSVGCEGLEVENKKNIFIADEPEKFAEYIIKLLKDKRLRRKIAKNGRRLIEKKYRWDKIVNKLDKIYQKLVNK